MNRSAEQRSPEQIEREVHQTQDRIAETFDELMNRLHPMDLLRSMFSSGSGTSSQAWEQARRNPLALGMITAGMAWLFSGYDARLGAFTRRSSDYGEGVDHHDPHANYVRHMAALEQRENEPQAEYQRRRDAARGTYLMIERRHDEDDASYRQRLDEATEEMRSRSAAFGHRMREMAHGAGSGVSSAGSSISQAGRSAANGAQDLFFGNPLVSGLLAAAVGAAAGAATPMTEAEHDKLGEAGEAARRTASQKAAEAAQKANQTIAF